MGLSQSGGRKQYVQIVGGKFAVRVDKDTEGAVERTLAKGNSAGKVVYELLYDTLSGRITNISYNVKEFGDVIEIEIDGELVLSIPWSNGVKSSLICRLCNVDFAQEVLFKIFIGHKGSAVLIMYQSGDLVPLRYTKDAPEDMPKAKQISVRGVEKWDFTEVDNFLFDVLNRQIERFYGKPAQAQAAAPTEEDF